MTNKKTFAVNVHWDVAKVFEIEAETAEEAESIMQKRINAGEVNPNTGETEFYE